MQKRIFISIISIALPFMIAVSVALILILSGEPENNEIVSYFGIAVITIIVATVLIFIFAGYSARKLTASFVQTLDNIRLNGYNISTYNELMQFTVDLENQKRDFNRRIEDLSSRADTIETITSNMQEGLILTKTDGTIIAANNSVQRIFGENIDRKNILHICREREFQDAVKQCLAGENAEIEMERNGRIYTVFFSTVTTGSNGKSTRGSVILFHDTTERYRAEKQRREFSANVSHELKTPLTTISAIAEMISHGIAKEDDIKTFADRITEQSGRLLVLIEDIIRLSEFDEGRANKEVTNFNLWELAESIIKSHKDNAGSVEIELTGDAFNITANSRMIDELLYNLIDNGIKYNKENGKVIVELSRVETGLCKISVTDTGIGISEEHHPHIFERFYRAEKSRSKKTGGTGLGLSIVKHITEYYNGNVKLESKEGEGTVITCHLVG